MGVRPHSIRPVPVGKEVRLAWVAGEEGPAFRREEWDRGLEDALKRELEDVARDLRVHDVETSGRPRHTEEEEHRAEGSARCSTGRRDVPPLPQRYALRVRAIESIQRSLASVEVEGEPART